VTKIHFADAASCTYISYCDTIRNQILKGSQSSELVKLRNQPKNHGIGAFRFVDGVEPFATVPVLFESGPGTAPWIWNSC